MPTFTALPADTAKALLEVEYIHLARLHSHTYHPVCRKDSGASSVFIAKYSGGLREGRLIHVPRNTAKRGPVEDLPRRLFVVSSLTIITIYVTP
jgi:hypothetical protein